MRNRRQPRGRNVRKYSGPRQGSSNRDRPVEEFIVRRNLDINCNLGQGFGIYQNPHELKFLPYVTSVNVPCGLHAGDPLTISRTVEAVKNSNVCVGALIGFDDKVTCGEREMYPHVDEIRAMVLYQLGALYGILHAKGLQINHVRAHGFLYKLLYTDVLIAETVAKAVKEFSTWITMVGLSGHVLSTACANANIKPGHEVQISKRYRKDGTILPNNSFTTKNALEEAGKRAREIIQTGRITCEDGSRIRLNVDTIHIPSDTEQSVELARTVRALVPEPRSINLEKYDKYLGAMTVLG